MASSAAMDLQEEPDEIEAFVSVLDPNAPIDALPPNASLRNKDILLLHDRFGELGKEKFRFIVECLIANDAELVNDVRKQSPRQFGDKLDRFLKSSKNERRGSASYKDFANKIYDLRIADRSKQITARKKRGAERSTASVDANLIEEKRQCQSEVSAIKELYEGEVEKLREAKREIEELERKRREDSETMKEMKVVEAKYEAEIITLKVEVSRWMENCEVKEEQINNLLEELKTLTQSKRGIQSGKVRAVAAAARRSRESTPERPSTRDCGVNTTIKDIKQDLLIVSEIEGALNQYIGQKFYGFDPERRNVSRGIQNKYFELVANTKPAALVSLQSIRIRAKFIDDVTVAASGSQLDDDLKRVYTEVIKQRKPLFIDCLKEAGIRVSGELTAEQTINLQSLLRMTNNQMRNMRVIFDKFDLNHLASDRQTCKLKRKMTEHVSVEKVETGFIGLHKTKKDEKVTPCAYLRVRNLHTFMKEHIEMDSFVELQDPRFENRWWLYFSGDKGGDHMKYHFEIVNGMGSGAVESVHLYCMFEANDTVENMQKVWSFYHAQVEEMQKEGYVLCGKFVYVFLGGDYHFLDDNLGHQGASATYPSCIDYVQLNDLQNHGGKPHTPEDCSHVVRRTIKQIKLDYTENLVDSRNNSDMHKNGHDHNSICGPLLFPIHTIDQVVPASLHILLGVTLVGYNLMNDECKAIDGEQNSDTTDDENAWISASLAHSEALDKQKTHADSIIRLTNLVSRQEALEVGDTKLNIQLAAASVVSFGRKKKRKVKSVEKCASISCLATIHDEQLRMLVCDKCKLSVHTICEALTPVETLAISADDVFECLKCSGKSAHLLQIF